jgi:hypothetical protein
MTEKNIYSHEGSHQVLSSHVPSRPSLFKTLEGVKEQVEYQHFAHEIRQGSGKWYIDPIFNELCLIIAEVYVKPPDSIMRIRGGEIEAAFVQEVYHSLTHEHIEHVAEKFKEQTHLIHKKTPYLQTALYNVLFEYGASIVNDLRHTGLI